MQQVKDFIVKTSDLPYSIIVVGVGNEKFKTLKVLDGDKMILRDYMGEST